jgi:hypothetical protein
MNSSVATSEFSSVLVLVQCVLCSHLLLPLAVSESVSVLVS